MYVYKALVHCLPASNKLKLVQLVNQNSPKVVDVIQLAYYHFGVIAQVSGQYAGATLVRVEQAEQGRNFIVEHCCVAEKFRRHGFARDMLKIVQDEVQQYDKATMELALDDEMFFCSSCFAGISMELERLVVGQFDDDLHDRVGLVRRKDAVVELGLVLVLDGEKVGGVQDLEVGLLEVLRHRGECDDERKARRRGRPRRDASCAH